VSLVLAFVIPAAAQAPATGTGTITGRVSAPATNEFLRDAEVRVQGTEIVAITQPGGFYRLDNVPAGTVKVVVTFAGYAPAEADINVTAGERATRDFEVSASAAGETIQMEAYVVQSAKEGDAKALQQQRASMTMGRSVSSDAFGDVTEGNVGEFLKFLPGVELEYVEADTRGPRLGGMGSEYTNVTMDGMKLGSADAFTQYVAFENSAAGNSARSFGFEMVSINSVASIEVNRVQSAAMEAEGIAGNIDMKMKRAFELKGRRIGLNLSTVMNSEEFTFNKTIGPNDGSDYKFKPNYGLNFSDVFFNNRLGILVGISESNLYNEQYRVDHTYNRSPTASDPRPQVLTQILLKDGPKWTKRFSTTASADFRASDDLSLSLGVTYNSYAAAFYNRQVTMRASDNNTGAATGRQFVQGDGITSYGTGASNASSRRLIFGGGNGLKFTNTINIIPKFEYDIGDFRFDGALAYSHSRNDYDNLSHNTVGNTTVNDIQNATFTAQRSSPDKADWTFTQTSGGAGDWTDLALQTNPRITDDNRQADNDIWTGTLNGRYTPGFKIPTFFRFGALYRETYTKFRNSNPYDTWTYVGPGGGATGSFANFPTRFEIFKGEDQVGVNFRSVNGGGAPAFANRDALGALFKTNPEYFVRNETTLANTTAGNNFGAQLNYENGLYRNTVDLKEITSSGYLMANTRIKGLQLQGGVRYELTEIEAKEFDIRTNAEIVAAGFPVTPAGNPTTFAGMDYRYASQPRVTRKGDYHNYFPSVTAKYNILPNLMADMGWGKTLKRPAPGLLSSARSIDDVNQIVVAPNPNLRPEYSEKVVGALSYYFGKTGNNIVEVVGSHNKITGQILGRTLTDIEFGNTEPELAGYDFVSTTNADNPITFRSLEFNYKQRLNFLPYVLRGTSINGSYTRSYADRRSFGTVPHSVKGGIDYRFGKFSFNVKGIWVDDTPWFQGTTNRYRKANTKWDVGGAYKLTDVVSIYFSGRNIFEEPHRIYESPTVGEDVLFRLENYGTNWTVGVKAEF
jgi:iron complex outermembrane recepter protein